MAQRVLIIEDHAETAKVIAEILKAEKMECSIASDGPSGLEKAFKEKPDLILLDVMMPEMSGFEVCKKLKESSETAKIPIIIVSVRATAEDINKGLSCGAVDYMTKPFIVSKLIETVKKHIG